MATAMRELLLVQPDKVQAESLKRSLTEHLYARVVIAPDVREALGTLKRTSVDAIVCDIRLPDMNLSRFVRMIRSGRFCVSSTPVVALTNGSDSCALTPVSNDLHITMYDHELWTDLPAVIEQSIKHLRRPSVLIIEDDVQAAESGRLALSKQYAVDVAHDGFAGFEKWMAKQHDVVFLDYMLPGCTGAEVLARIMAANPHQPVVIITGYASEQRHEELILAGATEFVEKPFDISTLRLLVEHVLRDTSALSVHDTIQATNESLRHLSNRVRVAGYNLERGQTASAAEQLRRAISSLKVDTVNDDEWTALLQDY